MKRLLITILIILGCFACNKVLGPDNTVTVCFTYSIEGNLFSQYLVFENCSENASSYVWDFGDSTNSIEENPTHYYISGGVYIVSLTASNSTSSDTFIDTILVNWTTVKKPNIYLYPQEDIDIHVSLEFPKGGEVIESVPIYNNGWYVHVDNKGKIDNKYDYLFYEAIQPDVWQYDKGWCIERELLLEFFQTNLQGYNFTEEEISDFIDYWIPRLIDYDFYNIYPQEGNIIEKVIKINLSIQPKNINRLFYVVIGKMEYEQLEASSINTFYRNGFTVTEWGVILK